VGIDEAVRSAIGLQPESALMATTLIAGDIDVGGVDGHCVEAVIDGK
jgi:hypothetical protein